MKKKKAGVGACEINVKNLTHTGSKRCINAYFTEYETKRENKRQLKT